MKWTVCGILVAGQLMGCWLAIAQTNTSPVIQVSPGSLCFGAVAGGATATDTVTVINAGGGVLVGTATVPVPFSVVSGGTYSLVGNQSQAVRVSYCPSGLNDAAAVSFTGGGGATVSVSGSLQPGLSFSPCGGSITAPFVTNGLGYISQEVTTGVADGGHAIYDFHIANAGNYIITASVKAPDPAANSFYLNVDREPTDPTMIWDIPVGSGFTNRTVSWRGSGTPVADQYVPKVFSLTAGSHELVVIGREAGTLLGTISITPFEAPPPAPPSPPQNFRVVSQ
jgi:hypothetical protein